MGLNIQNIPAKSVSYGGSRYLSNIKFIVIHYTGNNNDSAIANANYFKNTNTRSAGAHFFVDRQGNVVQSIDMSLIAWSVGGSKYSNCGTTGGGKYYGVCTNSNSVSIELCDIASKSPSDKQVDATKELISYIQKHCVNAKTIIRHFDVTGKSCPATMTTSSSWNTFLNRLNVSKGSSVSTNTSIKNVKFKVVTDDGTALNIRKSGNASSEIVGTVPNGKKVVATGKIINNWYRIKYNKVIGYVNSKYLKKVKKTSVNKKSNVANYTIGKTYETKVDNLNIRVSPSVNAAKKTYAQLSVNARQNANSKGQLRKGTPVTCKSVKTADGYVWIKIPSGWIAAYVISSKEYYVK